MTPPDFYTPTAVTIRRSGQFIVIDPPCKALLSLRTNMVTVGPQPPHGGAVSRVELPLFHVTSDQSNTPVAYCWAGLTPAVYEVLAKSGCEIRLLGAGPATLPEPDLLQLGRHEPLDVAMLDYVRHHDRALVRIDSRRLVPARLIGQLALAWRKARVLILVTRRDEAAELCDSLRAYTPLACRRANIHMTALVAS